MTGLTIQTSNLTKKFGGFVALDNANVTINAGTVHALLGENGAGKSTFVKCLAGYHRAESGSILLDNRETEINSPSAARERGIGMVYQHFTAVPGMTVAENLLLARGALPHKIDWARENSALDAFMQTMPFQLKLSSRADSLAAGERQKLEILKQLYLKPRLLILDEPSSVLTPDEADQVLGLLSERAHSANTTIILITHKFREVLGFADDVTVLRLGKVQLSMPVPKQNDEAVKAQLATAMMGAEKPKSVATKSDSTSDESVLAIQNLAARNDKGNTAFESISLKVNRYEIVGIAGVAGNGQRELMQTIARQRKAIAGTVTVSGEDFIASREQYRRLKVRALPEEPLNNACIGSMSVEENLSLRLFDTPTLSKAGWLSKAALRKLSSKLISEFNVKTRSPSAPIKDLSGGNVQRAVLARELHQPASLLLVANPVFGLDFAAAAEIYDRILALRNSGSAVLWISEDLDELLTYADRILVMSDGKIAFEAAANQIDRTTIGRYMAGAKQ